MTSTLRTLAIAATLTLLSPTLWAHDGEPHPAADPQAPPAVDLPTQADDPRARDYFTDLPVMDQHGTRQRFYSDVLRGRVVLINVIYTNCESSCSVMTEQLSVVRDKLGARFGTEIFFVSISVDPERDSPRALREFAGKFGALDPGWIFLTGAKPDIDEIISRLGQYSAAPDEHSTLLLAGNLTTRHWIKLRPDSPLPALAYRLRELADESPARP